MRGKLRKIEIDAETADALERRAANCGKSVSELLGELIELEAGREPAGPVEIAELDRRWAKVQQGEPTVSHEDVVRWLETWGTPAFQARGKQ